jgi:hypothetical protein
MKTDFITTFEEYFSLCVKANSYVDCMRIMIPKYTKYREIVKQKHPQIWDNILLIIKTYHNERIQSEVPS